MSQAFKASARLGYLFLALGLILLDRWSKAAVAGALPLYSSVEIVPGFFNLVHTRNTGIAFSLFADSAPWIRVFVLPVVSGAAALVVLWLFWKTEDAGKGTRLALTLVLAGAAGNLYDRIAYGYVVDFLDFYAGGWHWPAFNVADSCITVGAIYLLLDVGLRRESGEHKKREARAA